MKPEVKLLFKPLLLAGLLVLGFLLLHSQRWRAISELDLLVQLFRQHGFLAWPLFVAAGTLYTALGGPRQLLAFGCGYFMGGVPGAVASTVMTGFGALLVIFSVRYIGMDWMRRRHGERIEFLRRLLADDTWLWICMVRLMPVGSNLLTNIAAALAGLSTSAVFWGSLLGYLPQMLLFSFAGAGMTVQNRSQLWISLVLLLLSSALVLYLYHHGFKQRLQALREQVHESSDRAG